MRFDFEKDYILENERVKLVPLTKAHFRKLEGIADDAEIWTYFLGKSDGSNDFAQYIEDAVIGRKNQQQYAFAVFDKESQMFAGSTRFFDFSQDLNTIRLGYTWYGKKFRGTGINKHCKYLMFKFAFEELKAERVGLGAHEQNKVSIAAMKSVGCIHEGFIRNAFPAIQSTGRSNAVLLGIIKSEWFERVKFNLQQKL